ncbi:MpaA3 family daptide-type RiPP [Rathayibacter rathayi]|nr:MpaA3 family daptide-type RiPP [Rathayibacter rathayi]TWD69169.1 hypothetical protein FB469_0893 [Rathayibacter rathayi]SOE01706.1 hypothetical protein SAMN06295924_1017 [Rathayibacter rathayi NCPPB 2980 = VKM Ac-1601]
MNNIEALGFYPLDAMDTPLEWWETAGYAITALGGLVVIAAT